MTGNFDSTVKPGSIWVWAEEARHYMAEKQFAKIEDNATVNENSLLAFRNARVDDDTDANKTGSYLHGEGNGKQIRWNSLAVCKLTDANDVILYRLDDSNLLIPAVYTTVKDGFDAAAGKLYRKDGTPYRGSDLKLKLLMDYTLTAADQGISSRNVNLTFTTAEKKSDLSQDEIQKMAENGDTFFYNSSSRIATLSRSIDDVLSASMIAIESGSLKLTNIVLDGKNITASANGGIVSASAKSKLTIDDGAVLRNSKPPATAARCTWPTARRRR